MRRTVRAGWHNIARRPFFWSDNVEPYTLEQRRIDELLDAVARQQRQINALVNVVETLLSVSPLAHVNAADRPLAQWRRIARDGQ